MEIVENGKRYEIDDNGVVVQANVVANEEVDAIANELRIGDRVEVAGDTGSIVSITASVYGPAFGVRFDDGDIDEYAEMQLKRTTAEKPEATYDSPIEEVFALYDTYSAMPSYTEDEIQAKAAVARKLNLKAVNLRGRITQQAGIRDSKLDSIVVETNADLSDMQTWQQTADNKSNKDYLTSLNRYRIAEEIGGMGGGVGANSDASWLGNAYDGMEVVETTDTDLAARAAEMVAQFNREQLEDDDFMHTAASLQHEYLQLDEAKAKRFASYLTRARATRLEELPVESKTASVDDDLSDFDPASLYL